MPAKEFVRKSGVSFDLRTVKFPSAQTFVGETGYSDPELRGRLYSGHGHYQSFSSSVCTSSNRRGAARSPSVSTTRCGDHLEGLDNEIAGRAMA